MPAPVRAGHTAGTPAVDPQGAGIQGWGQAKRTAVNVLLLAGAEPRILSHSGFAETGLKGKCPKEASQCFNDID